MTSKQTYLVPHVRHLPFAPPDLLFSLSILPSLFWLPVGFVNEDWRKKWREKVTSGYVFPWSSSWRVTLGWLHLWNDNCSFQVSLHFLIVSASFWYHLSPITFRFGATSAHLQYPLWCSCIYHTLAFNLYVNKLFQKSIHLTVIFFCREPYKYRVMHSCAFYNALWRQERSLFYVNNSSMDIEGSLRSPGGLSHRKKKKE